MKVVKDSWRWFLNHGSLILGAVSTIFFAFPAITSVSEIQKIPWTVSVGAVLVVVALFLAVFKERKLLDEDKLTKEIRDLEEDIAELIEGNPDELFSDILRRFLRRLGLVQDINYRASVYTEDTANCFFLVGRYSDHPEFKKKGRTSYKTDGLIHQAWTAGPVKVSLKSDPTNTSEYLTEQTHHGITKKTASNLRMKSRHYYGFCVRERNDDRVVVVMLESTKEENLFTDKWLNKKDVKTAIEQLRKKVLKYSKSIIKPSTASNEGL